MNNKEFCLYIQEKINYNTTNYFIIETYNFMILGTNAELKNNKITILNAKIIDKNDYQNSFFTKFYSIEISDIENFNNCHKAKYDEYFIEMEPEYKNLFNNN